jgi:hypothetical protein
MPTVWDDTKVIQSSIAQYAVVARRSGEDWFIGAMNAGTTRTLNVPLDFLSSGKAYIAHRFIYDPSVPTRTHVRIDRTNVLNSTALQVTLGAASGEAIRITPVERMAFRSISCDPNGAVSLVATGKLSQPYSLRASPNLSPPLLSWSLISTGLVTTNPFMLIDSTAMGLARRFYLLSTP